MFSPSIPSPSRFSRRKTLFGSLYRLVAILVLVFQQSNAFQGSSVILQSWRSKVYYGEVRRQRHKLYATNLKSKTEVNKDASLNSSDDTVVSPLAAENGAFNPEVVTEMMPSNDDVERLKNTVLFLCWGVTLISALDRVAMSVAMVPLSAEFGFTDTMKGSVSSLFSVGYGLGIVPAGIIVATASPRIVMACGIVVWSMATIATPYAAAYQSMIPLLLARASVGAAESVVLPTLQTMLSSWTSKEQKSRSLATVFSGFHAGTVAAYLISPMIIEYLGGWRNLFVIYGCIGLFWLIPWMLLAKDQPPALETRTSNSGVVVDVAPSDKAGTVAASAESVAESKDLVSEISKSFETLEAAPWVEFAKSKGTWAMLLAHAANNWGLYNLLSWSPTFYNQQYGLSVKDSALYSLLPSLAGAAGGLLAGYLSDALLQNINEEEDEEKRVEATTKVRKAFQGAALGIPAIALFTLSSHIPDHPWVAQSLLMCTTGLQAFNAAGYLSANQEKAGEKWAGLLYSITSLPAVMMGTAGVYCTGQILDYTHQDWSVVFALNAAIFVLGAASFVTLYDSKREFD